MDRTEFDAFLKDAEVRLERLRSLYEQYFIGIEKLEPTVARKDVERRFWELRRARVRNTAQRFKLQTLIQRYNSLQQYWIRICRQIENGTYTRHLRKAAQRFGRDAVEAPSTMGWGSADQEDDESRSPTTFDLGAELDREMVTDPATREAIEGALDGLERRAAGKVPPDPSEVPPYQDEQRKRRPPPRRPPPGRLSEAKIGQLYEELLATRAKLRHTGVVSHESVANRLRQTEQQLRTKHPDRAIDFRVEVRGGKAVIKPVLR